MKNWMFRNFTLFSLIVMVAFSLFGFDSATTIERNTLPNKLSENLASPDD